MYYSTIWENDDIARVCYEDFWNSNKAIDGYIRRRCIPAWSLARLIEMVASKWQEYMVFLPDAYDEIISDIEIEIGRGDFPKEYLVC